MKRFLTLDGYHIEVWVFNPYNYSAHVFVANKPGEHVNSGNSKVYHLHGRDAYDTPALKAHSFRGGMKTQTDASRYII